MQPPTIAKGQNLGQCSIRFTTKATNHMAAQSTHWRNIPRNKKKSVSGAQPDIRKLVLRNINEML